MKRGRAFWGAAAVAMAWSAVAPAHHALEFIEMESATTLERGHGLFYLRYDVLSGAREDAALNRWELTPGLAWGLTDRWMLDAHVHYARFGEGYVTGARAGAFGTEGPPPFFEAAAFTIQYRLTGNASRLQAAVSATYELPFSRAEDLLGAESVIEGTFILAYGFGRHASAVLNLTVGRDGDEGFEAVAFGIRAPLGADPHGIAAGIEFEADPGDFGDTWRVMPGVYFPIDGGRTILKTGFGFGRSMEETQAAVVVMHAF